MTRRSLLAVGAGALASRLVRPRSALARIAGPRQPSVEARWVGQLTPEPRTIELTRVADLLGVQWRGPDDARIELRFRTADGRWSGWASAASRGHGPEPPAATEGIVGEPIWAGGTTAVQVRADRVVDRVRLHLVDVSAGVGARRLAASAGVLAAAVASLPLAPATLAAGVGQPPIIARRAWALGISPPSVAPEYGAVRMAFVHHTDSPNGYSAGEVPAMVRGIYMFHRYVNRWNDIGYNFVLDRFGRAFEARAGGIDEPVVGAHAGGYNLHSTGVAVLGTYMSASISPAARGTLERLLAWKLSLHGVPAQGSVAVRVNPAGAVYSRFPANALVSLPRIAGHRDGDTTDCPGDVLYGELPGVRAGAATLAGTPTRATLALGTASTPLPGGQPTTPAPAAVPTLLGSLRRLDGTPLPGAQVLLQARTVSRRGEVVAERTTAEVVTDAQGAWSLPAALPAARAGRVWLRALYPGSSAASGTVSEPLLLAVTAAPGGRQPSA